MNDAEGKSQVASATGSVGRGGPQGAQMRQVLLFVRTVASVVAAILFIYAGTELRGLESVAGNTVAEAFYQKMGFFAYGMAALSLAVGLPLPGRADRLNPMPESTIAEVRSQFSGEPKP
jgi:hypothetical protein